MKRRTTIPRRLRDRRAGKSPYFNKKKRPFKYPNPLDQPQPDAGKGSRS